MLRQDRPVIHPIQEEALRFRGALDHRTPEDGGRRAGHDGEPAQLRNVEAMDKSLVHQRTIAVFASRLASE